MVWRRRCCDGEKLDLSGLEKLNFMEDYYSEIVGGEEHRKSFIPFNISDAIHDVIIAYMDGIAIGCAGLKKYSESDTEVKRVWVEPEYPPYDEMDGAICFAKEL